MACAACNRNRQTKQAIHTSTARAAQVQATSEPNMAYRDFASVKRQDLLNPPYLANDIKVYQNGLMRGFIQSRDFPTDKHKLIIFYPKSNTPVCETELGALEKWRPEFEKLGFHLVAACIDYVPVTHKWFTTEEMLKDAKYPVLSSRLLPQKLGLLRSDGSLRRSSVFITKDGEMVKMEHFERVGRSLAELHRMAYAYTQDSYCAEGWKSPEDGFLQEKAS